MSQIPQSSLDSDSTSPVSQIPQSSLDSDSTSLVSQIPQSSLDSDSVYKAACTSTDPSEWFPIRSCTTDYWIQLGPESCRNKSLIGNYTSSKRFYNPTASKPKGQYRYFNDSMFYFSRPNGEVDLRDWRIPTRGAIYCFVCSLMSSGKDQFSSSSGFNDWKKGELKIHSHENSVSHRECVLKMCSRRSEKAQLEYGFEKQLSEKRQYWCQVLHRVVSVVTMLAERGLGLRGENEILGSKNNGNFLGCMELIAQFDPFLAGHLKEFGNAGRGTPSYLSSTIYEEIIEIMGKSQNHH